MPNTQIPKVIGYKRIADLQGDEGWDDAARFFWETVVERRSISIGGNSVREHFHPSEDFSSMLTSEQGPETCNTYNMLRLTKNVVSDQCGRTLYGLLRTGVVQSHFVYHRPGAGRLRIFHADAFGALPGVFPTADEFLVLCGLRNGKPCQIRRDDLRPQRG